MQGSFLTQLRHSLRSWAPLTRFSLCSVTHTKLRIYSYHFIISPLSLYFHLKLHLTRKGSLTALKIKYLFHSNSFLLNMYFLFVLETREDFLLLRIDNKQPDWVRIRSSELILQSRGTERETGKPDTALWQLTQTRKPKARRLSFPYFNKRQGRIWRTADTKAWYQFFCVFERQGILWNHLKVRTSPRPKKRKALSEKRPWILSLHYWFGR